MRLSKVLKAVAGLSFGILLVVGMYYAGALLPISVTWSRVTVFRRSPTLIEGLKPLDVLITLLAITATLVYSSMKRLLGTLIVGLLSAALLVVSWLTASPIAITLAGVAVLSYVLLVLMYEAELGRWVVAPVVGFSIVTSSILLGYMLGLVGGDYAYGMALVWRGVWRAIEWATPLVLVFTGIYWLIRALCTAPLSNGIRGASSSSGIGSALAVVGAIALPALIVVLLHLPPMNPRFMPVSVDTYYYWRFLNTAENHGLAQALIIHAGFARPLYLAALYYIYEYAIHNPVLLLDVVHPSIALGLLVYASYRLARSYSPRAATLAAILTACGPNVITFIAGGFHANSLALALALLALSIDPRTARDWVQKFVLYLAIALIHPWTFVMYAAIETAWSVLRTGWIQCSIAKILRRNQLPEPSTTSAKHVLYMLALLLLAYGIAEAVSIGLAVPVTPTRAVMQTLSVSFGSYFPRNLVWGMEIWTWSSLENPFEALAAASTVPPLPIALTLALPSILIMAAKSMIAYRLLLNVPIGLLAAIALSKRSRELKLVVVSASIAQTLSIAVGLTPLTHHPPIHG